MAQSSCSKHQPSLQARPVSLFIFSFMSISNIIAMQNRGTIHECRPAAVVHNQNQNKLYWPRMLAYTRNLSSVVVSSLKTCNNRQKFIQWFTVEGAKKLGLFPGVDPFKNIIISSLLYIQPPTQIHENQPVSLVALILLADRQTNGTKLKVSMFRTGINYL